MNKNDQQWKQERMVNPTIPVVGQGRSIKHFFPGKRTPKKTNRKEALKAIGTELTNEDLSMCLELHKKRTHEDNI
eukprot:2937-Amphidinium_carterae.1